MGCIFVCSLARKMLNFPPEVVYLVDVLGSIVNTLSELWFVSYLLHCNASNLMLEILIHDKIWETICISVPSTPNSGGLVPP